MYWIGTARALCVAVVVVLCDGIPAFADPVSDVLLPSASNGAHPEKFLYFSGFDLWHNGGSFYGGAQWAPGGLNENGFTLKLLLAECTYRYLAGSTNTLGTGLLASVLPGWRIKQGNLEIKAFAGLDLQNHRLSPDDPANNLRGSHAGLRVAVEAWWEPTATIMLSSFLSASTIGNTFGIRGAAGWRVLDRFWAGPEIEASGDDVYRQYRIGAHLTSFKAGAFEWALGAGYVQDNSHRSGLYGRIGVLTRR